MAGNSDKTLADLKPGQDGVVREITGSLDLKRRLSALGLVNGTTVSLGHKAPLGGPRAYDVLNYTLSLRSEEAAQVLLRQTE